MSMTAYVEERYENTYDSMYAVLSDRAQRDPLATAQHIRQNLKYMYVRQGNDWTGRGAIGNAGLDALVAAHEAVLAELTDKQKEKSHEREA